MSDLLLTTEGGVAYLTLNRPAQRNALSAALWQSLAKVIGEADKSSAHKVIVLSGAAGHFAAGADIGEFADTFATPERAAAYGEKVAAAMEAVASCRKPVIAQIEGACVGGGCGLALACDIRIAADSARLGITPGKLGLAYSLADTKRLTDAVGYSQAKMMLFTGRLMVANEALAIGLVDRVVEAAALAETVRAVAGEIASASQVSARITKATIRLIASGVAADTDETLSWYVEAASSADFAEGRAAFMEKRKPRFPVR